MSPVNRRIHQKLPMSAPAITRPPALQIAVASGAVATNAMPAFTNGISRLYYFVSRVFRTAGRSRPTSPSSLKDTAAILFTSKIGYIASAKITLPEPAAGLSASVDM